MLLQKGHASINKMTTATKPFWWPRMARDTQKMLEMHCLQMACKNIKAQIPMSELIDLPPVEKSKRRIQNKISNWISLDQ